MGILCSLLGPCLWAPASPAPRPPLPPRQGFKLPESLRASNDIKEVAAFGEIILMVIPTPFVERTVGGPE